MDKELQEMNVWLKEISEHLRMLVCLKQDEFKYLKGSHNQK